MSYKKIIRPSKEELQIYLDRKLAAQHFGVSERTIVRWQKDYGLYNPKPGYGRGKLKKAVQEIRDKHNRGEAVKDLAAEHEVTPSAIGRVIHNITYRFPKFDIKGSAIVSVEYRPTS